MVSFFVGFTIFGMVDRLRGRGALSARFSSLIVWRRAVALRQFRNKNNKHKLATEIVEWNQRAETRNRGADRIPLSAFAIEHSAKRACTTSNTDDCLVSRIHRMWWEISCLQTIFEYLHVAFHTFESLQDDSPFANSPPFAPSQAHTIS